VALDEPARLSRFGRGMLAVPQAGLIPAKRQRCNFQQGRASAEPNMRGGNRSRRLHSSWSPQNLPCFCRLSTRSNILVTAEAGCPSSIATGVDRAGVLTSSRPNEQLSTTPPAFPAWRGKFASPDRQEAAFLRRKSHRRPGVTKQFAAWAVERPAGHHPPSRSEGALRLAPPLQSIRL
jgi:hypothetical protein